METVFTSSYKTVLKENTKNHTSNSYVLDFLISVIFFCLQFGTEGVLFNELSKIKKVRKLILRDGLPINLKICQLWS